MNSPTFRVEKLAHGGEGIVRDGPHTIFVPLVIPGEEIRIAMRPRAGPVLRAEAIEIVSPSPDRVDPPCPLFGRCGGCHLQHISYPAQVRLKGEILKEVLKRLGRLQVQAGPIIGAASPFHYRSRIKLHVLRRRLGFYAQGKKQFIRIDRCHLAREEINELMPALLVLVEARRPRTAELVREEDGEIFAVLADRQPAVYRLQRSGRGKEIEWVRAREKQLAFSQVNPEQNRALRQIVSRLAAGAGRETALELYAGAGNLTEALLPHCQKIIAVEKDRAAVELGRQKLAGVSGGRLEFMAMSAEQYLAAARPGKDAPGLVLLDPPRSGARAVVEGILGLAPARIIYVSCQPATLARDLGRLTAGGYELRELTVLDMFPQTSHIESVSLLARTGR